MYSEFYEFYVKGSVRTYVRVCYQSVLQCIEFTSEEFYVYSFSSYSFISYKSYNNIYQLLFISTCSILSFYVNRVMNEGKSTLTHQRCCVHWHLIGLSDPMVLARLITMHAQHSSCLCVFHIRWCLNYEVQITIAHILVDIIMIWVPLSVK